MASPSSALAPPFVDDAFSAKVKDIIATYLVLPVEFVADHIKLSVDLGVDSFESTNIMIAIEIEFDIEIDDITCGLFVTVGDIVDHVHSLNKVEQ